MLARNTIQYLLFSIGIVFLSSCSQDKSTEPNTQPEVETLASVDDLPECTSEMEGRVYYVIEDGEHRVCSSGDYVLVPTSSLPGSYDQEGQSPLVRVLEEGYGGRNCPGGGSVIQYGVDKNRNGLLDENEITNVRLVCNELNVVAFYALDSLLRFPNSRTLITLDNDGAVESQISFSYRTTNIARDANSGTLYFTEGSTTLKLRLQNGTIQTRTANAGPTSYKFHALAFDSIRNQLLIFSNTSEGHFYSYSPLLDSWSSLGSMNNLDVESATFDSDNDRLILLDKHFQTIIEMNSEGDTISVTPVQGLTYDSYAEHRLYYSAGLLYLVRHTLGDRSIVRTLYHLNRETGVTTPLNSENLTVEMQF